VGLVVLLGLLAVVGVGVVWARERVVPEQAAPTAGTPPPVARPAFATATAVTAAAETAGPVADLAMARATQPPEPPTKEPTRPPTPMPTLRQWDATAAGIQIDPVLVGQLDQALVGVEGTVSVAVKDLGSRRGAVLNGDREMEAASLFKLEVLYAVFDAGLPMTEQLPVTAEARAYDAGTMELAANNGEYLSVAEALERMVTISDNTSAIMLAGRVGSARITRGLGTLGMDTTHYSLERMTTSTLDMLAWLEAVADGQAVSRSASAEMVHLLLRQRVNDRLPRLLPNDARVAHKTGNLPGVVNDVGVIYGPNSTVAVAALVSDTSNEAAAAAAIARVGMVAHSFFEDQPVERDRPSIPEQPQRAIPPTWREPKPVVLPTFTPTPEPEPEPTEPPEPTRAPPTLQPTAVVPVVPAPATPMPKPVMPTVAPTVAPPPACAAETHARRPRLRSGRATARGARATPHRRRVQAGPTAVDLQPPFFEKKNGKPPNVTSANVTRDRSAEKSPATTLRSAPASGPARASTETTAPPTRAAWAGRTVPTAPSRPETPRRPTPADAPPSTAPARARNSGSGSARASASRTAPRWPVAGAAYPPRPRARDSADSEPRWPRS
jgi:beta-lactamase class A